ncbi:MAG TPA: zinc-dependent metalloprotease, partial [Gemmatimonadaceae bacterium]|nr:zinc-dependent metalloprotease [Gemmatimonadaceae bacterium]
AYGPDSAPVINVTRLYTTEVHEFVGLHGHLIEGRSYVERAVAFPDNVEVEATQTAVSGDDDSPTTTSALVHWSMVRLPDHPMRPRRADERVGYITVTQYDFGTPEQRVAHRDYITRWRLQKQDTTAALSDPVTPITFYIDPGIPERWKPWVKKGIEDWQPAFETAGFSHAIVAKDAPVQDPDWSMDDVRHTMIRWLPSTTENAYGGPVLTDPRTGEVLNGTVHLYHNVLNLLRDWYVVQVGPLDARAQQLPLPDSLVGRLLEYVVAHEVGHSLGLPHDQLGSSEYPADSIRSRTWVHRMGHTPSLMDYSRFNYVAQPEDSIALADLIPRIGPYDLFSIHWGYTPIPTVATTDAERPTLDLWAREQDTVPWYRFSEDNAGGYGTLSEAVGDANPVQSTGYGIKNIRRVLGFLQHEALQPGEDNSDLHELYQRTLSQWQREMLHVVTVVGGSSVQYKSGSQQGPVYAPLPAAQQRAAVQFLDSAAFHTPTYFVDAPLTRRFEPSGTVARIVTTESRILSSLLSTPRLHRVEEYDVMAQDKRNGRDAGYPLATMLQDVRYGVWTELSRPQVRIDAYRQGLQQAYLDQLNTKLNPPKSSSGGSAQRARGNDASDESGLSAEERALLRGELLALRADLTKAVPRAADRTTRLHLQTVSSEIGTILTPNHEGGR